MENLAFRQPDWRPMNQTPSVMRLRRILVPINSRDSTAATLRAAAAFAPFGGVAGEKMINVLQVNLELRKRCGAPS